MFTSEMCYDTFGSNGTARSAGKNKTNKKGLRLMTVFHDGKKIV